MNVIDDVTTTATDDLGAVLEPLSVKSFKGSGEITSINRQSGISTGIPRVPRHWL